MERGKAKRFLIFGVLAIAIAGMILGLFAYNGKLKKSIDYNACDTLTELCEQQRFSLSTKFQGDMRVIENIAKVMPYLPAEKDKILQISMELVENTDFEYLIISDLKGQSLTSSGKKVNISDRDYFKEAAAGKSVISAPVFSVTDGETILLPIATPVYNSDHEIISVLIGIYALENLNKFILPSYQGAGSAYVTDSHGAMIVGPEEKNDIFKTEKMGDNIFTAMEQSQLSRLDSKIEMMDRMSRGEAGHCVLFANGENYFMHYIPLNINDWYVFMAVPETSIVSQAAGVWDSTAALTAGMLCLVLVLMSYILRLQNNSNRQNRIHTKELEQIAYYDEVTGLYNLYRFRALGNAMVTEHPEKRFVIIKFDFLNFKVINEVFGFEVGNQVLAMVARTLTEFREDNHLEHLLCARSSADEFVLLNVPTQDMEIAKNCIFVFGEKLNHNLSPILGEHKVELCAGRYFLEDSEMDFDASFEKANLAHRAAKKQKGQSVRDFDESLHSKFLRKFEIEKKMDAALVDKTFRVYLQPKYDLRTQEIEGAEALVRWEEEVGKMTSPAEFIPLFEQNGFITKLDMYMFEEVCILIRSWLDEGLHIVPISVNFSRLHLGDENFVDKLETISTNYRIPRKYIEIELTESVFMENEDMLEKLLLDLHQGGFMLSMDDFGTGYSSLGLLKNLPVDIIKIDRSFFDDNKYKTRARSVIGSIMDMAKKLGITTVAEGVETKEHIDFLEEVGCDMVQGFYFSKPMPAEEFSVGKRHVINIVPSVHPLEIPTLIPFKNGKELYPVEIPRALYRLFQFGIGEVLERQYGIGEAQEVFRLTGHNAGRVFARVWLNLELDNASFLKELTERLLEMKVCNIIVDDGENCREGITFKIQGQFDGQEELVQEAVLSPYKKGFLEGVFREYTDEIWTTLEFESDSTECLSKCFVLKRMFE